MEIVTLDMKQYLGRGIKVYFNDGTAINYKPTGLINDKKWTGFDDEGNPRTIRMDKILFVKAAEKAVTI